MGVPVYVTFSLLLVWSSLGWFFLGLFVASGPEYLYPFPIRVVFSYCFFKYVICPFLSCPFYIPVMCVLDVASEFSDGPYFFLFFSSVQLQWFPLLCLPVWLSVPLYHLIYIPFISAIQLYTFNSGYFLTPY